MLQRIIAVKRRGNAKDKAVGTLLYEPSGARN